MITGTIGMVILGTACASTPVASSESGSPATVRSVVTAVESAPPPAIHATGTDYAAIARSLTTYRTWLLAHHPDAALAGEVYTRGTTTYQRFVSDLDRMPREPQPGVSVGESLTFSVASVHGALVTLRVHERAPRPRDFVMVMTRAATGRWRIADFTSVPRAAPAEVGDGRLGGTPPELGVGLLVSVPGTGGNGNDTYGADDPSAPRPLYVRAIPAEVGQDGAGGLSNLCRTPRGPTGPEYALGNGWWFDIDLFASADGRFIATIDAVCEPLDPAARDQAPPPPPVEQPPTVGELWRSVGLPAPAIGVSPATRGITGLPTWVWVNGAATPVAVSLSLRGYSITGTASVVGYGVFTGDGGWIRRGRAGGPTDPAVTHIYEKTGTYRLGVATLWSAGAVITGPGITFPFTLDLGTALVTSGRDYPVIQIRSRLLG